MVPELFTFNANIITALSWLVYKWVMGVCGASFFHSVIYQLDAATNNNVFFYHEIATAFKKGFAVMEA